MLFTLQETTAEHEAACSHYFTSIDTVGSHIFITQHHLKDLFFSFFKRLACKRSGLTGELLRELCETNSYMYCVDLWPGQSRTSEQTDRLTLKEQIRWSRSPQSKCALFAKFLNCPCNRQNGRNCFGYLCCT